MDHSRALRRFHAFAERPCPHFVRSGGQECAQLEEGVGGFDETVHAAFLQTYLLKEHLPLFVALQLRYLALYLRRQHQHLRIFILDSLAHLFDVGVAAYRGVLIDVADVHDRFVGQQKQVFGCGFLLFVLQFHGARVLALRQRLAVFDEHLQLQLGKLVSSGFRCFLAFLNTALHRLQVLQL